MNITKGREWVAAHNRRLKDGHSFGKGVVSCVRFIAPLAEELVICSSLHNELLAANRYLLIAGML